MDLKQLFAQIELAVLAKAMAGNRDLLEKARSDFHAAFRARDSQIEELVAALNRIKATNSLNVIDRITDAALAKYKATR